MSNREYDSAVEIAELIKKAENANLGYDLERIKSFI